MTSTGVRCEKHIVRCPCQSNTTTTHTYTRSHRVHMHAHDISCMLLLQPDEKALAGRVEYRIRCRRQLYHQGVWHATWTTWVHTAPHQTMYTRPTHAQSVVSCYRVSSHLVSSSRLGSHRGCYVGCHVISRLLLVSYTVVRAQRCDASVVACVDVRGNVCVCACVCVLSWLVSLSHCRELVSMHAGFDISFGVVSHHIGWDKTQAHNTSHRIAQD